MLYVYLFNRVHVDIVEVSMVKQSWLAQPQLRWRYFYKSTRGSDGLSCIVLSDMLIVAVWYGMYDNLSMMGTEA